MKLIKNDLKMLGISHDNFVSEKDLVKKNLVEKFDTFPVCVIGQIQSTFKDNKKIIFGTGTLIGPGLVFTSASNIFRKDLGKKINLNINFY